VALAVVVAFGFGVLSFLAPCTVPLLPAYAAVLATGRGLIAGALLYVLGFTLVFVSLGLAAGALPLDGPGAQRVGGAVVLALAVALLLDVSPRVPRLAGAAGVTAPFALGVVAGTAFTPCVGPFLGAVLTLGALEGASLRGGVLLASYSLGLGVPFVAAAYAVTVSPPLARALNRAARPLRLVGAALLVALGLLLVSGAYGRLASALADVVA
jgi:cytochrome c-type biogenesis protein